MPTQKPMPYRWGKQTANRLVDVKQAIHRHISNGLDNGPGWLVIRGDHVWEVEVHVSLAKKPAPHAKLYGSGT